MVAWARKVKENGKGASRCPLGNMLVESEQPTQKACLGCYNQMGDFH